MKQILFPLVISFLSIVGQSQTINSLIIINKEKNNKQTDRTAEMNNMSSFLRTLAKQFIVQEQYENL